MNTNLSTVACFHWIRLDSSCHFLCVCIIPLKVSILLVTYLFLFRTVFRSHETIPWVISFRFCQKLLIPYFLVYCHVIYPPCFRYIFQYRVLLVVYLIGILPNSFQMLFILLYFSWPGFEGPVISISFSSKHISPKYIRVCRLIFSIAISFPVSLLKMFSGFHSNTALSSSSRIHLIIY